MILANTWAYTPTTLGVHIFDIIFLRALEQMTRVATRGIVTSMQNVDIIRRGHRAVEFISYSMRCCSARGGRGIVSGRMSLLFIWGTFDPSDSDPKSSELNHHKKKLRTL